MIPIAVVALLVAAYGQYLRNLNRRTVQIRYERRLYALRDHLRSLAYDRKVNPTHWLYLYLDSMIGRSTAQLGRFNLWVLLWVSFARRHEGEAHRHHLRVTLDNPEHTELRQVHEQYVQMLFRFLVEQHFGSLIAFLRLAHRPLALAGRVKAVVIQLVEITTLAPETSPLSDFTHKSRDAFAR